MSSNNQHEVQTRDVFVSYSRKNSNFAEALVSELDASGLKPWLDIHTILPAEKWWTSIIHGIDEAHTFIPIITMEFLSSAICTMELAYAIQNHKRIIPIKLTDEPIDDSTFYGRIAAIAVKGHLHDIVGEQDLIILARQNWVHLQAINWILFPNPNSLELGISKLSQAIIADVQHLQFSRSLHLRAREWEQNGRDESFLLKGTELRNATVWLELFGGKHPHTSPLQLIYIQSSEDYQALIEANENLRREREFEYQRRAKTRLRAVVVSLSLFSFVTFILIILVINSRNEAETARATAVARGAEVEQVAMVGVALDSYHEGNDAKALAITVEANFVDHQSPYAQRVLTELLSLPGTRRDFTRLLQRNTNVFPANSIHMSMDGRFIALVRAEWAHDGYVTRVIVLSVETGQTIFGLPGFPHDFFFGSVVALSEDGKLLAVYINGNLSLWSVPNRKLVWEHVIDRTDQIKTLEVHSSRGVLAHTQDSQLMIWNIAGDIVATNLVTKQIILVF